MRACLEIIYKPEVERNLNVCPKCNYHFRIPALERIHSVVDEGTFQEFGDDLESVDMLGFTDTKKYNDRLKEAKKKTTRREAVITGAARINGIDAVLAVLDFEFLGGRWDASWGKKSPCPRNCPGMEAPLVIFSASGGARMQEGTLSLMQMAKTSAALARLSDAKIPFISVMTDPTTGGWPRASPCSATSSYPSPGLSSALPDPASSSRRSSRNSRKDSSAQSSSWSTGWWT